jgi:hypothetical protein
MMPIGSEVQGVARSDPCSRLVVGEIIDVDPMIDSLPDSLFCLIRVIYSAITGVPTLIE